MDIYFSDNLYLFGNIGYANWYSELKQKAIIVIDGKESLWAEFSEQSNGYSPKAGIGFGYRLNEYLIIGFQYDHYYKLGNGDQLIEADYVLNGDLGKALTGHSPVKLSLDSYSLLVRLNS